MHDVLFSIAESTCINERKFFADNLTIPCPYPRGDCTWHQLRNNEIVPILPEEIGNNNSITLLGNNRFSYGMFTAISSTNSSSCYTVCPPPSGIVIYALLFH